MVSVVKEVSVVRGASGLVSKCVSVVRGVSGLVRGGVLQASHGCS